MNSLSNKFTSHKKINWLYISLALCVSLLPAIFTYVFIYYGMNDHIQNFTPTFWNDQITYWHEALTFKTVGFNGGYYATDEHIPAIRFFHFGAHGPAYAVLFGLLGSVVGWNYYTPILINIAFLTIGIGLYILITKPTIQQLLWLGGILVTFAPILNYTSLISQESFHQAAAMVFAAIFYHLLTGPKQCSPAFKGLSLLFILSMAYFRFTWGLLFFPFFALLSPHTRIHQFLSLLLSIFCIGGIYFFSQISSVIWTNHIIYLMVEAFKRSFSEGIHLIMTIFANNWIFLFQDKSFLKSGAVLQTLGLIFILMFYLINNRKPEIEKPNYFSKNELLFHLFTLGTIFFFVFILYIAAGGERILGASMLLSLLIMIKGKQYQGVAFILVINILLFPMLLNQIKTLWSLNTRVPPQTIRELSTEIQEVIQYQPNAENSWCNTLLVSLDNYSEKVLAVPGGIGVSFLMPGRLNQIEKPLKSHYIMLNVEKLSRIKREYPMNLTPLIQLEDGTMIYKNHDAGCERYNTLEPIIEKNIIIR